MIIRSSNPFLRRSSTSAVIRSFLPVSSMPENGLPILNQGKGLDALSYMVDNLKAGIYNPASIESFNEEVRRIYSSGQAAFGLNWIYMYNLSNDPQESQIAGDSEIALIPGFPDGNKSASCNGGMGLSIVNTCKNPDVAWDYISFLCSRDIQKKYSANALPIWISLYDDPELIALNLKLFLLLRNKYSMCLIGHNFLGIRNFPNC